MDLYEICGIEEQDIWDGMPEYHIEDLQKQKTYATIDIKIQTKEDLEKLSELIGKNLTHKTPSMWYPPREPDQLKYYSYIDEEDLEKYKEQIEEIIE